MNRHTNQNRIPLFLMALLILASAAVCRAEGFSFGGTEGKSGTCLSCHANPAAVSGKMLIDPTRYTRTTHAKIGCPSCHDSVPAAHPQGGVPARAECAECHSEIAQQYGSSIHAGKTRCAGCHNPHKVKSPAEISGQEINTMCSSCHDVLKMTATHGQWLPQADLHIRMLPCITCHTGAKSYYISMYIVKGQNGSRFGKQEMASYDELKSLAGGVEIVALVDKNHDNYISIQELRNFNNDPAHKNLHLQGMMTPETVTHNFEILDNRRNCSFCHTSGSTVMQTSYLTFPGRDGTYQRVAVEKGAIFDALYGTPDFYLMGSTKNQNLNRIGLAIICGGLIMPVGHGFLRFLTRKNREKKEHES
ncbi:cytochrome c3 family protein [Geomonas terrae]|nr:cytochrome c3 family protein [Geomonas terrae]